MATSVSIVRERLSRAARFGGLRQRLAERRIDEHLALESWHREDRGQEQMVEMARQRDGHTDIARTAEWAKSYSAARALEALLTTEGQRLAYGRMIAAIDRTRDVIEVDELLEEREMAAMRRSLAQQLEAGERRLRFHREGTSLFTDPEGTAERPS